jgi:hypothetical protein
MILKKYFINFSGMVKMTRKEEFEDTKGVIRIRRLTRRVSVLEQELLTLPEHLSSPRFFVGFVLLYV